LARCRARLAAARLLEQEATTRYEPEHLNNSLISTELSIFIQLFPFAHAEPSLEWLHSLASGAPAFVARRARLGTSLVTLARIRVLQAEASSSLAHLNAAYTSASHAVGLMRGAVVRGATVRISGNDHTVEEEVTAAGRVMEAVCDQGREILEGMDEATLVKALGRRLCLFFIHISSNWLHLAGPTTCCVSSVQC
jgi:hypothetical protein